MASSPEDYQRHELQLHHGSWLLPRYHVFVPVRDQFEIIRILFKRALATTRTRRRRRDVEGIVSSAAVFQEKEDAGKCNCNYTTSNSDSNSNSRTLGQTTCRSSCGCFSRRGTRGRDRGGRSSRGCRRRRGSWFRLVYPKLATLKSLGYRTNVRTHTAGIVEFECRGVPVGGAEG